MDKVLHYEEKELSYPVHVEGNLTGSNMPFTIKFQSPWQRHMMVKYGHNRSVSIDATLGTNNKKVWKTIQFMSYPILRPFLQL